MTRDRSEFVQGRNLTRNMPLLYLRVTEAVDQRCSVRKVFLEISQNSRKNTCARVSFLIKLSQACNFIKKETLAQVFFCEFCEISENTFSYKTPPVAASEVNVRPYLINISKTRGGFSLLNFNLFQQKFTIFTKKFHHRYFSGILNSCSIVLCGIVTTK